MNRLALLFSIPLLCWSVDARAQIGGFLDRARQKAENAATSSAERAARKAIEGDKNKKQDEAAEEGGEEEEQASRKSKRKKSSQQADGSGAADGEAAPTGVAAGEVYGNRFDFVPGDKVVVYDDFSDTEVGEYPARWTMKDHGGGNAVEVVEHGGRRFFKSRYQKQGHQDGSLQWLRYTPKGDMPNKFTVELDADMAGPFSVVFSNVSNFGGQEIRFNWERGEVATPNASGTIPSPKGVQHVSIAVSGTQVKVYVGGERVLIDSDGVNRPIKRLGMHFLNNTGEGKGDHQMFTAFRLAEGGKDAKTMLVTGRIVTHGILFDTGSDVLKPESGPTLRSILSLLKDDPGLAFTIEGHTDDQGGPKVNGPLSEKRAQAVRAWLVKQGVEERRLTARGLGDTKPIDSNATSEGRANNRRVEFVKMDARAQN